jgi:hypothetical protein
MENHPKVITLGALGKYDNLRPQVKPVKATYEEITEMRDQGKLIPGQYYQITDYVTTVNGATITNARSAGHQFDILVRADSVSTLNEQAWAVRHEGDTYFKDARLEAWELKYRLDNVQWSKQAGTYVTYEDNGYTFLLIGDITLSGYTYKLLQGFGTYLEVWGDYALMETLADGEDIYAYDGVPEDFDPDEADVVGTASGIEEVTEAGKGTITWMKDEHGNECPYDFKNVQFKRYMATDSVSGREGLGGKYMVADPDNCPQGLSVEDAEDFIWAYTFSSDNSGGEQTDYSLDGTHGVYDNVIKDGRQGLLPDNVCFGQNTYANIFSQECYHNSLSHHCAWNNFAPGCYGNSLAEHCASNVFSEGCNGNSFANTCSHNYFGEECLGNSFAQGCSDNTFSTNCAYNRLSEYCLFNEFSTDCRQNRLSAHCNSNTFAQAVEYVRLSSAYMRWVVIESGNRHLNVLCADSTSTAGMCQNIKIEQGVGYTSVEKTVSIPTSGQDYQIVFKNPNSVEIPLTEELIQ